MCRISQHGLVFSLIADPSEALWIEIRRERDQAVVVSAPFTGPASSFEAEVADWIDTYFTSLVNELELETCFACGGRRPDLSSDEGEITAVDAIQDRFALCPPCAQHLVASNPWIVQLFASDFCDD